MTTSETKEITGQNPLKFQPCDKPYRNLIGEEFPLWTAKLGEVRFLIVELGPSNWKGEVVSHPESSITPRRVYAQKREAIEQSLNSAAEEEGLI